jgi:hypothetical protein
LCLNPLSFGNEGVGLSRQKVCLGLRQVVFDNGPVVK